MEDDTITSGETAPAQESKRFGPFTSVVSLTAVLALAVVMAVTLFR